MPTGGRTPLARGLYLALEVLEMELMKDREVLPLLVLLSDGRANVGLQTTPGAGGAGNPTEEARAVASLVREKKLLSVVVDTELDFIKLGLAQLIAEAMGARYVKLDQLRADRLADAVRLNLPAGDQPELSADQVQSLVRRLGVT
jgi:magnesium chelatase subunit D